MEIPTQMYFTRNGEQLSTIYKEVDIAKELERMCKNNEKVHDTCEHKEA